MNANYLASAVIPHSRPTFGLEERQAALAAFDSMEIAEGNQIESFESEMSEWLHRRYAIATHCGSSALELALRMVELRSDDEVIIPSYSCAALANAVFAAGGTPVLADICSEDLNLCADTIGSLITPRTRAIIVTHTHGIPANIPELRRDGVLLIEDLAQCLGASCHDRPVGSWGDLVVCSFYPTKLLNSIDGGMLLTDNPRWANMARDLRYYGGKYDFKKRFNFKMTNIAACIGLTQLKKLSHFLSVRRELAHRYTECLSRMEVPFCFTDPVHRQRIYYRYCIQVRNSAKFIGRMREMGVACGRGILQPLHRAMEYSDEKWPNTSKAADTLVSIPIYPSLGSEEIAAILTALEYAINDQ